MVRNIYASGRNQQKKSKNQLEKRCGSMKRKVYETGRITTLHEMRSFFTLICGLFPVIDKFISTHELINNAITDNECYFVSFGAKKTVLYLKHL